MQWQDSACCVCEPWRPTVDSVGAPLVVVVALRHHRIALLIGSARTQRSGCIRLALEELVVGARVEGAESRGPTAGRRTERLSMRGLDHGTRISTMRGLHHGTRISGTPFVAGFDGSSAELDGRSELAWEIAARTSARRATRVSRGCASMHLFVDVHLSDGRGPQRRGVAEGDERGEVRLCTGMSHTPPQLDRVRLCYGHHSHDGRGSM
jgi:hypothetical protein